MIDSDHAWWDELVRFGFGALFLVLLGLLFGHLVFLLLTGIACYLIWHLYQVYLLSRWLEDPKNARLPYPFGIWKYIIFTLQEMQAKGRKRKQKLSKMLSGFLESTGALPDATVVLDESEQLEWWNGVASSLLGFSKKDRGEKLVDLVRDPVFRSYLSDGDFARPLHMPAPTNETVSLEVRIVPYGKGKLLMQARDITRLQQLEQVRRDFVANVSHEIRTPLTVVSGYLETMIDSGDEGLKGWRRILQQMQQQTGRIKSIVEDLLLISRLETTDKEEGQGIVGVANILQVIVNNARELSGESAHVIELEADDRLCLIGHPKEFESAFSNLVYNAVRYTPAGGRITIRWWLSGSGPRFAVADSGIGIDPAHIPRLTERFYRVDIGRSRERGGTGLGLAIVKHVLNRHEGHLEIESEPGKGSTFTCCFPHSRIAS